MKKTYLLLLFLLPFLGIHAQENLGYQLPPQEILELADAKPAPIVRMDDAGKNFYFAYRDNYKSIAELSEKELRLGGLRINPKTNIGSRQNYSNQIKIRVGRDNAEETVAGLPTKGRFANMSWSPDETKLALTNTVETGVELWIIDFNTKSATKVTDANLNANIGSPFMWLKNSNELLVKKIPNSRKELINTASTVPVGPTISVSEEGVKAQNRTYQDLLKNKNDEFNFEQLATAELYKVSLDGTTTLWKEKNMYRGMSVSPNGQYVMLTTIDKPFSYLVTYGRFPSTSTIYDINGNKVYEALKVPLIEDLPKGFMSTRTGRRNISWRDDQPATIYWAEALDGGDPAKEVPYRDEAFQLKAPFTGTPTSLMKTVGRFSGVIWGNSTTAVAYDYWWNTRNTKTYLFNPSDNTKKATIIFDRNYQDSYSNPGNFITSENEYHESVLSIEKNNLYLIGDGYSKDGKKPFVDKFNIKTLKTKRIYESDYTNKTLDIMNAVDLKKGTFLIRLESQSEYPNYYIQNLKKNTPAVALTNFKNPFESIKDVKKEVITYKRDDGLELSGTLYLPTDYEKGKKYPMILWAYPREFKDKSSASQVTADANEFTFLYYGSPIYWVTRGYVVLDDASFPIIGEGDEEPNDTFIKQLVANGKAAIDAVDKLGYIDRTKVAVGGHSYGAFMTANLLTHSDLFAAGIARSGAYNRTLTPYGFQSEERSYWEAPEIYYNMSPFMHADKMKTPLLLIHGEADNNSGTYPLQSERYFNALKGMGAPVRLVMLPKESHGYRAKESIMHLLWEQDRWLEMHLKNKKPDSK
ncbi:dipeptidyl aminopeptidase/acylaminoacyl peptidase [Kordia periserrulae]|uniref:Dipeptidyl aminopeptidase/acylaminoacyl peptidase n=1 Tax=Kordia periserrulae TaxID=701523 RepID=A0A2T6BSJ4_9FLAO|nr:prolyl oligopeptidase family serine peptidase [Kordia periserrulae]PTX59019.1 dipeptidyl aminopeptidase/acylaminoacyl peptidase [Kordia periserrulae]